MKVRYGAISTAAWRAEGVIGELKVGDSLVPKVVIGGPCFEFFTALRFTSIASAGGVYPAHAYWNVCVRVFYCRASACALQLNTTQHNANQHQYCATQVQTSRCLGD